MTAISFIRIRKWLRNSIAGILGVVLIVLLLPSKARSQLGLDPCCAIITTGLATISNLLNSVVAAPLNAIQQIEQQAANFERQIVYPASAIASAQTVAVQSQGQFMQMRQISETPVSSATLTVPQQLEQNLLSRNVGTVGQVGGNYVALYGTVMPQSNAPQPVRDMVDMSDAEAQAAMKKAIEIDALADIELQAAKRINQQLQSAAAGTATILEAEASVWLVRAHAYTQSATAELLRVRAIDLANSSTQLKFGAGDMRTLRNNTTQALGR